MDYRGYSIKQSSGGFWYNVDGNSPICGDSLSEIKHKIDKRKDAKTTPCKIPGLLQALNRINKKEAKK